MEAKCHPTTTLRNIFFTVRIPQQLVIRSPRLGILYRVLQLLTLAGLLIYILLLRIWTDVATPQLEVAVWPELPLDPDRAANTDVRHCQSPWDYTYTTANLVYRAEECRKVSSTEGYVKQGDELLVATYIAESHIAGAQGQDCAGGTALCAGGLFVTLEDGKCECRRTREFFVHNPEEARVAFQHIFRSDDVEMRPKAMVSVFLREDGSRCQVGGMSEVRAVAQGGAEQAVGLVSGSLREWLGCAGVSLDDGPVEVGRPGDASITYLRTMGLRLVFDLRYSNTEGEYDSAFVCFITPTVQIAWTSANEHYLTFANLNYTQSHQQGRTVNGVRVRFQAGGKIRFFSAQVLITAVVNVLFLLTVPHIVVQLVATYCLGPLSRVYYQARTTYFDVHEQMRVALARSILPIMAFRALIGGDFSRRAESLPAIGRANLKLHIEDIFKEQIDAGTLEDRHVNRMVMMLCEDENGAELDKLNLQNFSRICMTNDLISSESLVAMLHYRRKKWALEKLLDDFGGSSADDDRIQKLIEKQGTEDDNPIRKREQLEQDNRDKFMQQHKDEMEKQNQSFAEVQQRIGNVESGVQDAQHSLRVVLTRAGSALEKTKSTEELVRKHQAQDNGGRNNAEARGRNNAEAMSGAERRLEELERKLEQAHRVSRSAKEEASRATLQVEALVGELQKLHTGKEKREKEKDNGSSAPKR